MILGEIKEGEMKDKKGEKVKDQKVMPYDFLTREFFGFVLNEHHVGHLRWFTIVICIMTALYFDLTRAVLRKVGLLKQDQPRSQRAQSTSARVTIYHERVYVII